MERIICEEGFVGKRQESVLTWTWLSQKILFEHTTFSVSPLSKTGITLRSEMGIRKDKHRQGFFGFHPTEKYVFAYYNSEK